MTSTQYPPARPLLLQAALSHLELALVNMEAQALSLSPCDQYPICESAMRLQRLASSVLRFEGTDMEHDTPIGEKFMIPELCLRAPPPECMPQTSSKQGSDTSTQDAEGLTPLKAPPAEFASKFMSLQPSSNDSEANHDAGAQEDGHSNGNSDVSGEGADLEDWLLRFMDIFDQVDADGSGTIETDEWKAAVSALGLPQRCAEEVFCIVDTSQDGSIQRPEWQQMLEQVQSGDCPEALKEFSSAMARMQAKNGRIYLPPPPVHEQTRCIIAPDTPVRILWDIVLIVILAAISIMLPYSIGFATEANRHDWLDRVHDLFDAFFVLDIILNFRTAYYHQECLVVEGRKIAVRYLRSWFLLDFLTCIPFEHMTRGFLPDLQPAKLLKLGKIIKVFKLCRLAKVTTVLRDTEFVEAVEDRLSHTNHQAFIRMISLFALLCYVCHWLACFMAAVGSGWSISGYTGRRLTYSAALYWAMMTLTTVGFGDIVPLGLWERMYSIGCMAIGGFFYGFMIGKMSSIIASRDLNASAYFERMELVRSWLDYHAELPQSLRRRIKRHYQKHLTHKAATDDASILKDLSPALVHDVSFYLVQEEVRCNILFHNLPFSAIALIMPILEKTSADPGECIVTKGDVGIAMYIIVQGSARFQEGHQWSTSSSTTDTVGKGSKAELFLTVGGSFGEEVVLGLESCYIYTVVAISYVSLLSIARQRFEETFKRMPDIKHRMHHDFINQDGEEQEAVCDKTQRAALPDAVLEALHDISMRVERTEGKFDEVHARVTRKMRAQSTTSSRAIRKRYAYGSEDSISTIGLAFRGLSQHSVRQEQIEPVADEKSPPIQLLPL